jgi:hypothetical protein
MTDLPERVDLPRAWRRGVFVLLASLAFLIIGSWIVSIGSLGGWIFVGFFVVGIPTGLSMLFGSEGVSLDRGGFEVRSLISRKRYRWTDVSKFSVVRMWDAHCIGFDDTARKRPLLDSVNRFAFGHSNWISNVLVGGNMNKACALMNAFRERALAEAAGGGIRAPD